MNPSESKEIWRTRLIELRKRILRREVAVFSFFLVLAFIFWFLNGLSKEMNGRIEYPVRYINFPTDRTLVNDLPDHFTITVNGPGYSIVQTKLGGRQKPLIVDLDKIAVTIMEDKERLKLFALTYNFRNNLDDQILSDFSIVSISPDTIFLELDQVANKMVPVIADIEVNTQRQFIVNGDIVCSPDSIEVSGPKVIIDTLSAVYTRHHTFDQISETESKDLNIKEIQRVSFSERRVNVTIPIEQFTEAVLELNISLVNFSDTTRVRLFPDKVTLTCIVPISDYNNIINAPVEAVVDLKDLDITKTSRLKIILNNVPEYVSQVRYNPQFVEYLIEKR